MENRILLVTTLPSEVSNVKTPAGVEMSVFDFSARPLGKKDFMSWLDDYVTYGNIGILITYRCPYIITPNIIDRLKECVNIHPLALPEFAGINPWGKFLASGMNSSEAVLHSMDYNADEGEIIMRERFTFASISDARRNADAAAARLLEKYIDHFGD